MAWSNQSANKLKAKTTSSSTSTTTKKTYTHSTSTTSSSSSSSFFATSSKEYSANSNDYLRGSASALHASPFRSTTYNAYQPSSLSKPISVDKYGLTNNGQNYVSPYRSNDRNAVGKNVALGALALSNRSPFQKAVPRGPFASTYNDVPQAPAFSTQTQTQLSTNTPARKISTVGVAAPQTPIVPAKVAEKPNSSYVSTGKAIALIFNHEEFKDKSHNREGSRKDEERLYRVLKKFGFEVEYKRNKTLKEIQRIVKDWSKKNYREYTCLMVVILTHGNVSETLQAFDEPYNLSDVIVSPLMTDNLSGKPKIFLINACKGSVDSSLSRSRPQTDSVPVKRIPKERDILKIYSTFEGFVSYRDPKSGSLFIQNFCDVLEKVGKEKHIHDIMTDVNKLLTEADSYKQVPTVVSTMSSNFYFGNILRR